MRILAEETVAVLVDVQERLFPHIHEREALQENLVKLIRGLKVLGVPILVTEQYVKGLGKTIAPLQEAVEEVTPLEKMSFSCCDSPEFSIELQQQGRNNVLLMGIETHVCVLQTALDLQEQGFQAVLVEDATSSRKESDKRIAVARMMHNRTLITTTESILFELCRVSGTTKFKEISKLVK